MWKLGAVSARGRTEELEEGEEEGGAETDDVDVDEACTAAAPPPPPAAPVAAGDAVEDAGAVADVRACGPTSILMRLFLIAVDMVGGRSAAADDDREVEDEEEIEEEDDFMPSRPSPIEG